MSDLPAPTIPETASPEDVLKWTLFYLSGFTNVVNQMTEILATEAHVEAHPKALVTLQRRARFMQDYGEMLRDYLDGRKSTPSESNGTDPEKQQR